MRLFLIFIATLGSLIAAPAAQAASFDCANASTDMEQAICADAELGRADETLAIAYATAIGGLSKSALASVRQNQREWLEHVRYLCISSDGAKADDAGRAACLIDPFEDRIALLEESRMTGGLRIYALGRYRALPDPFYADQPDSYWRMAEHAIAYPLIDGDDPVATGLNAMVESITLDFESPDEEDDASSNTTVTLAVIETADARISLQDVGSWFGHGAAHGNYSISYRHYLTDEQRELAATDLFAAPGWEDRLVALALAALEAQHGDALFGDHDAESIRASVIDPQSWSFESDYGLVIQFQPYEVAAYAYGAPTIVVSWTDLDPLLAEGANRIRWGN